MILVSALAVPLSPVLKSGVTSSSLLSLAVSIFKQALRKFSKTAKGWYWNMEKLYRKYTFKLYPMILVVNQYILLESSFEMMLSELKMSGK